MPDLFDSVTSIKGIGAVRAKQLAVLGIQTLYDLIAYFPRAYEDRTKLLTIDQLEPDTAACFEAMVITQPRTSHIRKGLDITKLTVADETGRLNLTFFNQSYISDQLLYGESYIFYGKLDGGLIGSSMQNPIFEKIHADGIVTRRIMPIYALTSGLSNKLLSKTISEALAACSDSIPEILPSALREKHQFCDVAYAYSSIHQPLDFDALNQARQRLIFEEFFVFSIGLALLRAQRVGVQRKSYSQIEILPFLDALPFPLTGAQRRAIDDIICDFTNAQPMNRLIQGDVGSGKTLIAAAAAYLAGKNGQQAALMAPTEILAEQHYSQLAPLFTQLGLQAVLLTASMSAAAKRAAKAAIADGSAQLIIGTHALLTGDVIFHALDLVIADEQHRFGVAQRAALSSKGHNPHLLVMSATPIPRTLSLIVYGDLDISLVDELPPGRQPIDTFLVGESKRARINSFIRKQVDEGHQVYIVCPAVEENEESSLKSAQVWAQTLQQVIFPDLNVGMIHGRMKGSEKESIMSSFADGKIQILVATTVIEVGVDAPNATLIVIENAERFGLSQLHQLRGRVGRGSAKSFCVMFSENKSPETCARLKVMCETNNGFTIADEDLKLRGPGDFFGQRQHGLPMFKVANLSCDLDTLKLAQAEAADFIAHPEYCDESARKSLHARIRALFQSSEIVLN